MSAVLTDVEKIRRLPWLAAGDVLNIVFVTLTFAGSVFVLFLAELGFDNAQIGFMLSLIPFCGIVAPFIAPMVTRFGYKRVYVTFWGVRKFAIALLLLTPAVLANFGPEQTFYWVAGVIFGFAMCRAIAETGGYPWKKEVVPDSIRGKFSAISSISTTVAGIIVTAGAGYVIEAGEGLERFMFLMAIGIGMGLLSVVAYGQVPGEGPRQSRENSPGHLRGMNLALHDKNFLLFLGSLGLATIGGTSVISFVPLFMKEQVALSEGVIVLLSIGTYMGSLITSYLWGWTADRYGSKPVMQSSLYIMLLLPVAWFILPRNTNASAPLAMSVAFLQGVATLAWQISWMRYLFVNATPTDNKTPYMSVFYAWYGFVAGVGPLLAGQMLTISQNISGQLFFFTIDPYTPLFVMSAILIIAGIAAVSLLQSERETTFRRFAGMFLRGNPIRALGVLIQYNFAGDEMTRISITERMGDTHSPLSSNELIEALNDPSFNVRYEAIQSIGRMPAEPELVDALIDVLEEGESELGMAACRSLGKLGDPRAIEPLRRALFAEYKLVQASSARALAMLGDTASIPHFLERLKTETNPTIRMAYVSTLGKLRAAAAIEPLFELLREVEPQVWRGEIALALARIVGDERYYLQHWRLIQADMGTATAQAVLALQKQAKHLRINTWANTAEQCSHCFARQELAQGAARLKEMLCRLPQDKIDDTLTQVIRRVSQNLSEFDETRPEFILLGLHVADVALQQLQSNGS